MVLLHAGLSLVMSRQAAISDALHGTVSRGGAAQVCQAGEIGEITVDSPSAALHEGCHNERRPPNGVGQETDCVPGHWRCSPVSGTALRPGKSFPTARNGALTISRLTANRNEVKLAVGKESTRQTAKYLPIGSWCRPSRAVRNLENFLCRGLVAFSSAKSTVYGTKLPVAGLATIMGLTSAAGNGLLAG